MEVNHQKNILYIDADKETYSGMSIYTVSGVNSELEGAAKELEILAQQIHVAKVEVVVEGAWKELEREKQIPKNTEKIRIAYFGDKKIQSVSFSNEKDKNEKEFVGYALDGCAETLFPLIDKRVEEVEMVYIVPNIAGMNVLSTGALVGVYDGGSTKTYHYKIKGERLGKIAFSGGVYEETSSGKTSVHIPARLSDRFVAGKKETLEVIKSSLALLQNALEFKLPITRFNIVFSTVEIENIVGSGFAVLNISQIMVPEAIDQCFSSIRVLAKIVSEQYFGIFSYSTAEADQWMYAGLAEHLTMFLLETFLGINEVKYEQNRWMEQIYREDVEEPPLSSSERRKSSLRSEFFVKKSGIFIRTLENNLTRAFMQKIMKEVLEMKNATTVDLVRVVKGITGKDVRSLFEWYVYKTGIPLIAVQVDQSSKATGLSVTIRQKFHSVHPEANRQISGNICLRVYETDSVMDHVLSVGSNTTTHEISGSHRSQKRKQKAEEAPSLLWIRMDPGLEWMKVGSIAQADYMFAEQLVSEKDVYGQMEALSGLQKNPSESVCAVLERVMADPNMFYKISISAGVLLAKSANEELGYFGFQRVVQYFISNYCIQNTTIVRTNDFLQFRSYFLQKNIAASMSLCQLDRTKTLGERTVRAKNVVSAFLLNLMRYNDNTGNPYEDSFYLADIITSLSMALCSDAYLDATPFVVEIEKLRRKDLVVPSHQNIVTCAAIKALTRLAVQGYLEISVKGMLPYVSKRNFYKVRMAAYESLVVLHSESVLKSVLARIIDESRVVRVHVLRIIRDAGRCAGLPLYEKLQRCREEVERVKKTYLGDSETEEVVEEILRLVSEPTEVVSGTGADEQAEHDLSNDEAEHPPRRIVVKLARPLIVKLPVLFENKVRVEDAPEPLPEERQTEISKEEESALYEADEHKKKYLLDEPPSKGIALLIDTLKTNKAATHIQQNSKKNQGVIEETLYTLDWIPSLEYEPKIEIDSLSSRIENSGEGYTMNHLYHQAMCVFRRFFTTVPYDTSSYSTVKYFQAFFEREYSRFRQLPNSQYGAVDAETEIGPGREVLKKMLEKIVKEDVYKIFTQPVDLAALKPFKYLEIVRRPLDIATIKSAVEGGWYAMAECACADVLHVFDVCVLYNQEGSNICKEAERLKELSLSLIKEALPHFKAKTTLAQVLHAVSLALCTSEYAIFQEKVKREEYPQYYHLVREPMTLSLVAERARSGYYRNLPHYEADVQKIYTASVIYNGNGSEITKLGKKLVQDAQTKIKEAFPWHMSTFTKRTRSTRRE